MSDVEQRRVAAREAEGRLEWEAALRLWDLAVAESPDPKYLDRYYAARAAVRAGRVEEGLDRLRALDKPPEYERMWNVLRAEIEMARGNNEEAIEWWQKAIEAAADPYWPLFGLARSLNELGRVREARRRMAEALESPSAEALGGKFAAALDFRCGAFDEGNAKLTAFDVNADDRDRAVVNSLPGMTTVDERWALREVARTQLTGAGEIVDLGCWLGSLTVALALGAKANPRLRSSDLRIHAYDNFVWYASYMNNSWRDSLPLDRPDDGESFLAVFQYLTNRWSDIIRVYPEDLKCARWHGEPIELLSVDAMKSEELAKSIISEFYPSLLPERALVFHQDYCHYYTWWIHLLHFLHRDHFEVVDPIEGSGGVLFRVVRPFDARDVANALAADLSDSGLAAEAFSFSMEQVGAADRSGVAAAYVCCEEANGRIESARELMRGFEREPWAGGELARFKGLVGL
jgi:hypothetical protein